MKSFSTRKEIFPFLTKAGQGTFTSSCLWKGAEVRFCWFSLFWKAWDFRPRDWAAEGSHFTHSQGRFWHLLRLYILSVIAGPLVSSFLQACKKKKKNAVETLLFIFGERSGPSFRGKQREPWVLWLWPCLVGDFLSSPVGHKGKVRRVKSKQKKIRKQAKKLKYFLVALSS